MATSAANARPEVTVTVKGMAYKGWTRCDVQRSLEAICGTFNVPVGLEPGFPPAIARQDAVTVQIGGVTVITGYVLAAEPFYNARDCGVRVLGRDRTGDMIRSSAIHLGGQWRQASLERIAKDLAGPFGIEVVTDVDVGPAITDFRLYHGESVLDALSRAARLRGVLVTRDDAGRLLLTRAGKERFSGSIRRGQNVVAMEGVGSDENRHSEYIVYGQGSVLGSEFDQARGLKARSVDAQITRHMPLIINADGNTTQDELQRLVEHTRRVRWGHSMGFRYTVEGWLVDGKPWPLNQRVAIYDDIAGLQGEEWLICDVRFTCDLREGDITELIVRPMEAYDTTPLKTRIHRRNWGNRGNRTNHPRGPHDDAWGGR